MPQYMPDITPYYIYKVLTNACVWLTNQKIKQKK